MTGGFLWFGVAALSTAALGCSGKSSQNDDDAGGGADAGSTPARPAKLGLHVAIRNPSPTVAEVAGRQCPTSTGVEWDIGKPIVMDDTVIRVDSPTPTDFGDTLEDGQAGTEVACTVTADGPFHIEGGGTDPQITAPSGIINFMFEGSATNPANLSLYTPITFALANQPGFPACTVTAIHEQSPGALWASFDCPALTDATKPNVACQATGTIVAEYCATE